MSTGTIRAVDNDQPGPFSTIEYLVKPGSKFSEYVAFENPLEGSLILTKRLDYETLRNFEASNILIQYSNIITSKILMFVFMLGVGHHISKRSGCPIAVE